MIAIQFMVTLIKHKAHETVGTDLLGVCVSDFMCSKRKVVDTLSEICFK